MYENHGSEDAETVWEPDKKSVEDGLSCAVKTKRHKKSVQTPFLCRFDISCDRFCSCIFSCLSNNTWQISALPNHLLNSSFNLV